MDKGTAPLISVIIPVYNVEKYLPDCLDSLLAQTYQNFELLCVNDGSPDNSQDVLERYARRDSRVKVFRKANGGVSSARNLGLERAQGAYIGFVDPDDRVRPQYLEKLLDALRQLDAPMAVCEEWKGTEQDVPAFCEDTEDAGIREVKLSEASYGAKTARRFCWGALYRRELVQTLRFDESLSIGEDTVFFLEAFRKAGRLARVQSRLYLYVQRKDSAYWKPDVAKQYTEFLAWKKIVEHTADVPGPLHASAEYELLMTARRLYYKILASSHRDTQKEKTLAEEVQRHKKRVYAIKPAAAWELRYKVQLLSMLYLPAGVNRVLWGSLERLHAGKTA